MEIGTYVAKAMSSELSGNVIDLCPVGALTSKPYRYSARAWELQQRDGIAPHDCLGSNLHFHIKGSKVKRVVPKDNAYINETWLSDRDRFSYQALAGEARLLTPKIKRDGEWHECDWEVALDAVADRLGQIGIDGDGGRIAALASPSSTTEEFYLLQRLIRELGGNSIDHRPRQVDFSADSTAPLAPCLGVDLAQLERADAILLIGSNTRHDQPLINHRIRKAALAGAKVITLNSIDYGFNFPVARKLIVPPSQMPAALGGLAKLLTRGAALDEDLRARLSAFSVSDEHESIVTLLQDAERCVVITGNFSERHSNYGQLSALASVVAAAASANYGRLTDGANCAGAWLAGAVPHRGPGGRKLVDIGLDADRMFDTPLAAYILLGLEPELDCIRPQKVLAALHSSFVVALTAFNNPSLETVADVLLPIAAFAENEGSYVNVLGQWQSFAPAVRPAGDARPAWKLLRVLGERLSLPGFDAINCVEVTRDIAALCDGAVKPSSALGTLKIEAPPKSSDQLEAVLEIPLYATDALVRHGEALQRAPQRNFESVYLSQSTAKQLGLIDGGQAVIKGDGAETLMTVVFDDTIGDGSYLVYAAHLGATAFSGAEQIKISKA